MKNKHLNPRNIVFIALFGAAAAVLMLFEIPLTFIVPEFIKLDFSELPVVLGAFMMGPVEGIFIATIKILMKLMFKPTSSAYVGEIANWIYSVCYIIPAAVVYRFKKGKGGAAVSLAAGTIVTSLVAVIANTFFIFPAYVKLYGMPMNVIIGMGTAVNSHITSMGTMMLFSILPFNLLKYGAVSVITFFSYKRLKNVLFGGNDSVKKAEAAHSAESA